MTAVSIHDRGLDENAFRVIAENNSEIVAIRCGQSWQVRGLPYHFVTFRNHSGSCPRGRTQTNGCPLSTALSHVFPKCRQSRKRSEILTEN